MRTTPLVRMAYGVVIALIFLIAGCGRNLITGEVIAEPVCQDVQVPYKEEMPVEKVIEVEREEIQYEPEPYSEESCAMAPYLFEISKEEESGWSAAKPYCAFTVTLGNPQDEQGEFTVVSAYTKNGAHNEQNKKVVVGKKSTLPVTFLADCSPSDVVLFDHAKVIPFDHKVCRTVTKFRSNPVTRKVKNSEIITQMEQVEKYRLERQCT